MRATLYQTSSKCASVRMSTERKRVLRRIRCDVPKVWLLEKRPITQIRVTKMTTAKWLKKVTLTQKGLLSTTPLNSPPTRHSSNMEDTEEVKRVKRTREEAADKGDFTQNGDTEKPAKMPKITDLMSVLAFGIMELQNVSDFRSYFNRIADVLLNHVKLHINDVPHRFIEIEFYLKDLQPTPSNKQGAMKTLSSYSSHFHKNFGYKHLTPVQGGVHMDYFTHCDEMQKTVGKWYFHRQGKSYRSGTYKGLDLTFGTPEAFGGILIRSIENLTDNQLIEGPCLVVDHILNLNDVASIDELVSGFDLDALTKNSKLYIAPANDLQPEEIIACPRVGLTLKKYGNGQEHFIMKPYRFLLRPNKLKKGKINIVLTLYTQGKTVEQIQAATGSPKKSIEKYIELFHQGKNKDLKSFFGKALPNDEFCECFGAAWNTA